MDSVEKAINVVLKESRIEAYDILVALRAADASLTGLRFPAANAMMSRTYVIDIKNEAESVMAQAREIVSSMDARLDNKEFI